MCGKGRIHAHKVAVSLWGFSWSGLLVCDFIFQSFPAQRCDLGSFKDLIELVTDTVCGCGWSCCLCVSNRCSALVSKGPYDCETEIRCC